MSLPAVLTANRRLFFAVLIGAGLLQVVALVGTALIIRSIIDSQQQLDLYSLPSLFSGLLLTSLAFISLRFASRVLAEKVGQSYAHDVRVSLFETLITNNKGLGEEKRADRLLIPFTGDLSALRRWVSLGLSGAITSSIVLLFSLVALAFYSMAAALAAFLVMALGIVINMALSKPVLKAVRNVRKQRSRMITNLTEKVAHPVVVSFFGRARRESGRHEKLSARLEQTLMKRSLLTRGMRAGTELTALWAGIAVLAVLLIFSDQSPSPGSVVAVVTLMGLLAMPLRELGRVYEYWLSARVSRKNLNKIYQQTGQGKRNRIIKSARGRLVMKGVALFQGNQAVDAKVLPGKRIALVGLNGAGKSTLLLACAGLYRPNTGLIQLDKKNVQRLTASSARRTIGIVSDLLPLMRGSLDKNLRYRYPGASIDEVNEIIEKCGLKELEASLPEGRSSKLNREGLNLSLGERRRVALARALLGTPDLLLLDEIESNLDIQFMRDVNKLLKDYPGTIIQATHDASIAAEADEVWQLSNGEISINVEHGDFFTSPDDGVDYLNRASGNG